MEMLSLLKGLEKATPMPRKYLADTWCGGLRPVL